MSSFRFVHLFVTKVFVQANVGILNISLPAESKKKAHFFVSTYSLYMFVSGNILQLPFCSVLAQCHVFLTMENNYKHHVCSHEFKQRNYIKDEINVDFSNNLSNQST